MAHEQIETCLPQIKEVDLTEDEKLMFECCGNAAIEHFKLPELQCAMFKCPTTNSYFFDINNQEGNHLITFRPVEINREQPRVSFESTEITFERSQENLIKESKVIAPWARLDKHQFLKYSEKKPQPSLVKQLAAYLLNHNKNPNNPPQITYHQYEKQHTIDVFSNDGTHQLTFRFDELVEQIRKLRSVRFEHFKLNRPECPWLDLKVHMGMMVHPGVHIQLALPFGNTFPLMPGVDREGAIFSSFQTQIQQNILQLHKAIVEESHRANSPSINPWMNNLRMLINECVSIVDITLHQLYIAAEYGLKSGTPLNWKFDPEKLGQRHGLRIKDKLHWVTLITGNVLGDAEKEVSAFNELREVRNHFSHFDPPCVALTVEDVMHWLNLVSSLGKLLWKIRDKLNAQLTPELVEIILLPTVELCPVYPHLPRPKQPANSGYGSTRWPTTTKPYKSHSIRTVERVLSNAVEVLATATGTIQERLYRAADFLFRLQEQELPNSLKANYFELRTKLIAPNDKGGNSLRVNTLSKSDDEASIYAGKIFAMQKELLLSYSLSIKRA